MCEGKHVCVECVCVSVCVCVCVYLGEGMVGWLSLLWFFMGDLCFSADDTVMLGPSEHSSGSPRSYTHTHTHTHTQTSDVG